MNRWTMGIAVTTSTLLACGVAAPSETMDPADVALEPLRCEEYRLPAELRFACNEARFDSELGRNAELFAELVEGLRARRGLRVTLRGTVSASAASERDRPELAAQRARSVAEALAREGIPRAIIEVDAEIGPQTAAYKKNDPDRCPPAAEDEHGDRRRAVFIDVILCEDTAHDVERSSHGAGALDGSRAAASSRSRLSKWPTASTHSR